MKWELLSRSRSVSDHRARRVSDSISQQERGGRRSGSSRRSSSGARPSKTLFVINFDPINTRSRDLERHFDPYGKISNIRIRRNFAFVQYESQEDATKALEATNMRSGKSLLCTYPWEPRMGPWPSLVHIISDHSNPSSILEKISIRSRRPTLVSHSSSFGIISFL